ncbi:DUF998 domain-containing protein [Saccharothrix yanglingensis]|uniref:DUF998 domain-containing protein n=1 Tax=Saccharothrix yanglingensis TaxID=659496 RepID=A0ABU0X7H1_9PSEU|nr:DUF998 domain-containing protein [Saccharothrix yanglingensis]MDQ2587916.1 hypothetical protein [Saccharothrix yanglingensis]
MTSIGAVAAVVFVVVFTVDGWTRPGYGPVRRPVSALALGSRGWIQPANFVVCGAGVCAGALALVSTSWPLSTAVEVFGVALVASGVFPMDAMRGYPPGTPDNTPEHYSRRHRLHDHAGAVVFVSLPAAAAIAALTPALGVPSRTYSAVTAGVFALFVVFGRAWEDDSPRAGLWQRLTILVGWAWLAHLFVLHQH